MAACCVDGPALEVGAGSGVFKEFFSGVVATDLLPCPWLDVVADAQALPFSDDSFANIVMFDVMHHIEWPRRFFAEVRRLLRPGGRLVAVEPAITPVSWVAYKFFHPEPVLLRQDPLVDGPPAISRDAFDANQAIPNLLFYRYREKFSTLFPELVIETLERVSLFAYPLSGGFRRWSLIPGWAVEPMLRFERLLIPLIGPLAAFRLLIVLRRTTP